MASRPLPPGRRGRGGRASPAQHLPDVKILNDASVTPTDETLTSSYVEQLRAERSPIVVPSKHLSTTKAEDFEPAPVRSVMAFVSSLEKAHGHVSPAYMSVAAAAGEVAPPPARVAQIAVSETANKFPANSAGSKVATPKPTAVLRAPKPLIQRTPEQVQVPKSEPAPVVRQDIQTPVQPARAPPQPAQSPTAAPSPSPLSVVATAPSAPGASVPVLEGFHPFKMLLPIHAVPVIPETIDCVYDDTAVEMQKNIMKAVKKIFGKDRAKLEDFKINSRLYGNNFMDPVEYLDSLVKDLGANRALVLVPCLVSIQPDFMKRSSMLVAARNYRLRNLAKLETTLDKVTVASPVTVAAPVHSAPPVGPVAVVVPDPILAQKPSDIPHIAQPSTVDSVRESKPVEHIVSEPLMPNAEPSMSETIGILASAAIEPPTVEVSPRIVASTTEAPAIDSSPAVVSTTKPKDDEKIDPTASFITVETNISSERSSLSSTTDAVETPTVVSPQPHRMRRKSTLSLFGDEIGDELDDTEDDADSTSNKTTADPINGVPAAPSPASPPPAPAAPFFEAESLFGEVMPVATKPAIDAPVVVASTAMKSPPSRMLFGFASAGADSDSDSDSEFSD